MKLGKRIKADISKLPGPILKAVDKQKDTSKIKPGLTPNNRKNHPNSKTIRDIKGGIVDPFKDYEELELEIKKLEARLPTIKTPKECEDIIKSVMVLSKRTCKFVSVSGIKSPHKTRVALHNRLTKIFNATGKEWINLGAPVRPR